MHACNLAICWFPSPFFRCPPHPLCLFPAFATAFHNCFSLHYPAQHAGYDPHIVNPHHSLWAGAPFLCTTLHHHLVGLKLHPLAWTVLMHLRIWHQVTQAHAHRNHHEEKRCMRFESAGKRVTSSRCTTWSSQSMSWSMGQNVVFHDTLEVAISKAVTFGRPRYHYCHDQSVFLASWMSYQPSSAGKHFFFLRQRKHRIMLPLCRVWSVVAAL